MTANLEEIVRNAQEIPFYHGITSNGIHARRHQRKQNQDAWHLTDANKRKQLSDAKNDLN